jgi:putative membrane-bound dehydrogenase-like protein
MIKISTLRFTVPPMLKRSSVCLAFLLTSANVTSTHAIAEGPLNVADSVAAMATHPGWKAAIVAHEPIVVDPVAIRIDRHHRMWVVEMSDYPTGPKPGAAPSGRVRLLEDRDHDGTYETATTFADSLLFPTGVQPWRDGAIVTLAGKIVWMRDVDGDGVADHQEVWFEGFAEDNSQLRANHPVLGPDGMVYVAGGLRGGTVRTKSDRFDAGVGELDLRDSDFFFDPDGGRWGTVMGKSQYGMTIDDYGRRIGCSNRNPAMYTLIDEAAIARDPLLTRRDAIFDIAQSGEASRVYPRAEAWTTSNLHGGQFSAACGVAAPGWMGDVDDAKSGKESLLVCEPTGYLVQRQWFGKDGAVWTSSRDENTNEFLASTDRWFRPVDIVPGPQGAVFVVDMYRAVIQHPDFAPQELKNRPDTWDGNDRGRIWKVSQVRDTQQEPEPSGEPEVSWLGHANPWVREIASQYFHEREDQEIAEMLRSVIADPATQPTAVARAVHRLVIHEKLDDVSLQTLLDHDQPRLRVLGISLLTTIEPFQKRLRKLASDEDAAVRLAVAARLAASEQVTSEAIDALISIARRDGEHLAAEKILGSVDAKLLAKLCKRATGDLELETRLVRHWWTRWAIVSPEQSLTMLVAELAHDSVAPKHQQRTVACFDGWLQGNAASGAGKLSQNAIADLLGPARLNSLRDSATRTAIDAQVADEFRVWAIRGAAALGELPESFWQLLEAEQSVDVRIAAASAWFANDADAFCRWLDERLPELPPSIRARAIELIVSKPASTAWLLDRIESGQWRPSLVPPQVGTRLISHRDTLISGRAKKLFATSGDRAQTIARYASVPAFQKVMDSADAHAGKRIFAQACAACHQIDGVGVNVGPDISDSRTKTPETLLTAVLDPNAAIDAAFLQYIALTTDGRVIDGLLTDDKPEGVTLRRQGGENVMIPRDELEKLQATGISLMPDGFERLINENDMANLISYLKNWRYLSAKPD